MRVRRMDTLRGEGRSTSSRASRRFRQVLVGLQIAITVVLLVGATVLISSIEHLHAVHLGLSPDAVGARVIFPDARTTSVERKTAFARSLVARARQLPGVRAAAIASDLPFADGYLSLGIQLEPGAPDVRPVTRIRLVGPGYFEALQIPMLAGRTFSSSDSKPGVHHAVVNRAFAKKFFGTQAAVGHRLSFGEDVAGKQIWYDVVGVTEDALDTSLTAPAPPIAYADAEMPAAITLLDQVDSGFAIVVRGDGSPEPLVAAMTAIVHDVDRDSAAYDVETIGDLVGRSYRQRTALEWILTALAFASILVAIIGLYGVTSYSVAERTSEIGVRRALGATRFAIIRLILTETAVVVGLGIVVGIICAFGMRSLLASFLYGVDAADPASYVLVCGGIAVVALLSALAPARAAGNVPPSRALKVG
jgi:predicted permease